MIVLRNNHLKYIKKNGISLIILILNDDNNNNTKEHVPFGGSLYAVTVDFRCKLHEHTKLRFACHTMHTEYNNLASSLFCFSIAVLQWTKHI